MPFKAKNNREAVVVCAIHVVKRPSKRSELVYTIKTRLKCICVYVYQAWGQAPKGLSPLDLSSFLRGLKSGLKSSFNKRA